MAVLTEPNVSSGLRAAQLFSLGGAQAVERVHLLTHTLSHTLYTFTFRKSLSHGKSCRERMGGYAPGWSLCVLVFCLFSFWGTKGAGELDFHT